MAALACALQALFYLATLVWPADTGVEALAIRLMLWQSYHLPALTGFVVIPLLAMLIWPAPGGLVRLLLLACLLASVALPVLALAQGEVLHRFLADPRAPRALLRLAGLARWADAGLALAALMALRLARQAEHEAPRPQPRTRP